MRFAANTLAALFLLDSLLIVSGLTAFELLALLLFLPKADALLPTGKRLPARFESSVS